MATRNTVARRRNARLAVVLTVVLLVSSMLASAVSASPNLSTETGWCEKTGSGTEILVFVKSTTTWKQLGFSLGFTGSGGVEFSIISLLAVWNDIPTPSEGAVVRRSLIKACYYWTYLPVMDTCYENGVLSTCLVGWDWVPINPDPSLRWTLPTTRNSSRSS